MSKQVNVNGDVDVQIEFTTMGMFIIDDIEYADQRPPVKDILGGAGTYSALGARIFSPSPFSKSVGWIVDCGSDFPPELRQVITEWKTSCLLRETPDRLTTRGWNKYGVNEHRAFKYLTPKLRLDEHALTPQLLRSKCFHLICQSTRCVSMVHGVLDRRKRECGVEFEAPIFVWEPVPDLCTPEELDSCKRALKVVDYVSPNHEELAAFYDAPANHNDRVNRVLVEDCAAKWLESGSEGGKLRAVIVRAGKEGCYVAERGECNWIPAYHQNSEKVIDPTGGGNAFLGGLAVDLARGSRVIDAAICGAVAASFAIEQVGVPKLTSIGPNDEQWNGEGALQRVKELRRRLF